MANFITTAPDGLGIDLDSAAQTYAYNGDGTLNYIQVISGGSTYRQTYTYSVGVLSGTSAWVKQ